MARPGRTNVASFIWVRVEAWKVRTIEVTGSRVGDGPMLPKLLEQIPPDETPGTITAGGAYVTRARHAAIAARQAQALVGAPIHRIGS